METKSKYFMKCRRITPIDSHWFMHIYKGPFCKCREVIRDRYSFEDTLFILLISLSSCTLINICLYIVFNTKMSTPIKFEVLIFHIKQNLYGLCSMKNNVSIINLVLYCKVKFSL